MPSNSSQQQEKRSPNISTVTLDSVDGDKEGGDRTKSAVYKSRRSGAETGDLRQSWINVKEQNLRLYNRTSIDSETEPLLNLVNQEGKKKGKSACFISNCREEKFSARQITCEIFVIVVQWRVGPPQHRVRELRRK